MHGMYKLKNKIIKDKENYLTFGFLPMWPSSEIVFLLNEIYSKI